MKNINTANGRELLFKGKTIGPNGAWIKGNGVLHSGNHSYAWIVRIVNGAADLVPVKPETVCQYSGLRDDKRTEEYPEGQRMFEGDIVTGLFSFGMSIYAVVAFQDGAFGLEWYIVARQSASLPLRASVMPPTRSSAISSTIPIL